MNSAKLFEQIHERMGEKSTGELLTIWKENDHGLWSDEAFKAIEEILSSHKVQLPAQGQIKKTVPQLQPLEESWEKPFISWAFYILFLLWIAVFHPFFFVAGFLPSLSKALSTLTLDNPLQV